ncbi:hypothetical protein [Actinomadura litoris]|uniref:Uncharacterized protein n=1 Tax=Actinomadura litoris TaxID=2678616 RepID=A0A7K1LE53_9ACTN|nr:hypothetical protein [Actinomadura litoris]MUN42546.1 hypothetical protein [Actinomadura litoris]
MVSPFAPPIACEDAQMFVNAAITSTGQREFHHDEGDQRLSPDLLRGSWGRGAAVLDGDGISTLADPRAAATRAEEEWAGFYDEVMARGDPARRGRAPSSSSTGSR